MLRTVQVMDRDKLGDMPGVYSLVWSQEKIKDVNELSKSYICSSRLYTLFSYDEDKCNEK